MSDQMRATAIGTQNLPTDQSREAAAIGRRQKLTAAGGIAAALGAASCCVVPFILFMLGVSGAWIGNLTALEPYQPVFAAGRFPRLLEAEGGLRGRFLLRPASFEPHGESWPLERGSARRDRGRLSVRRSCLPRFLKTWREP